MLQQQTKDRVDKFLCKFFIAAVDRDPSPFLIEQIAFKSELPSFTINVTWDCEGKISEGVDHFAEFKMEQADGSWTIVPHLTTFADYCGLYHNFDPEETNWLGIADIKTRDNEVDIESQMLEMISYGVDLTIGNAQFI